MQGLKGYVLFVCATLPFWMAANAIAACSGSGTTWSCAAGSTSAQVQTAVNSASDQAVITFANGTYTFTSVNLDNRNGITLICATVGGCTDNAGGNVFTFDFCSGNVTNLMRVSGFNFGGDAATAIIWWYCNSDLQKVRIDNNTFSIGASEIAILFGELSSTGHVYGVVDHNTFSGANNFMGMKNISGGATWVTGLQGSANSMFFENNRFTFNNFADLGTGGVDVWRANSTVVRFNTFTNSRVVNHSYCHEGPANSEVYMNTINAPNSIVPNYRNIHFQGSGEEIAWGNTVELEPGGNTIAIQHFRGDSSTATSEGNCNSLSNGTVNGTGVDAAHAKDGNRSPVGTYAGYPSWHQPGRDGAGTLKPVYSFMNKNAAGTKADMLINGCDSGAGCYIPQELIANRDFYNGVSANAQTSPSSPFNGTVGVGFGTLANRPTTCTPTSETLDAGHGGVAYWATDQGSWNTSGSGGQGVLYTCSAKNTWTLSYTPYTYPHPLTAGLGAPPPPPLAPMTSLQSLAK